MLTLFVLLPACGVVVATTTTLPTSDTTDKHLGSYDAMSFLSCARNCRKLNCEMFDFTTSNSTCGFNDIDRCRDIYRKQTKLETTLIWQALKSLKRPNKQIGVYKMVIGACALPLCPVPESFPNMTVSYELRTVNSLATYTCNDGLTFCGMDSKTVECRENATGKNATWEKLNAECSKTSWIYPSLPLYFSPTCKIKIGSEIEFKWKILNFTVSFEMSLFLHLRVTFFSNSLLCYGKSDLQNVYDHSGIQGDPNYDVTVKRFWNRTEEFVVKVVIGSRAYQIVVANQTVCYITRNSSYDGKESIFVQSGNPLMYVLNGTAARAKRSGKMAEPVNVNVDDRPDRCQLLYRVENIHRASRIDWRLEQRDDQYYAVFEATVDGQEYYHESRPMSQEIYDNFREDTPNRETASGSFKVKLLKRTRMELGSYFH